MSLDLGLYVRCKPAGDGGVHYLYLCDWNITHNVSAMWKAAGCYDALYKSHGKKAIEVVEDVQKAISAMTADPEKYRSLDSSNGWGTYDEALPWLQEVRSGMESYPLARIRVSK